MTNVTALNAMRRGKRPSVPAGPPSVSELQRARATAARLVLRHGDGYMPLFERVDREIEALSQQDSKLARLRMLAAG
ncbi:hypothetical protein SAMN05216548_10743 [Faunimonas pinastri]|uniref:Uncharacterized protein n=1 Tax=Faunimonas pinastri TaxID=1855383 RepID=A0A1H9IB76_9HYPH|nr:hypothetical protein SAMN05216548_10743 [Faunimonas pinastri]